MSGFNLYPRPDERLKEQEPIYDVGKFLLAETSDSCTCFGGDAQYGHERGCGQEPLGDLRTMVEFATVASAAIREAHLAIVSGSGEDPSDIIRRAYAKLYPHNELHDLPEGELF